MSLNYSTNYDVAMSEGAFKNMLGNDCDGITKGEWSFTTEAQSMLVSLSPQNGATEVPRATDLVLTFDRTMVKGTGNITVYEGYTVKWIIPVTDAKVTVVGTTVTVDLDELEANLPYSVAVDAGAFEDTIGNPSAAIPQSDWGFTTVNMPIVIAYAPENDETDVSVNTNLMMTYNENVQTGTGNVEIYENDVLVMTIPVTDPRVTIVENKVTVALT